ncbi:YSIRK-type signal peptide-containing protein, partial [uncultured Gemella sp.]|uniref:YSIRK-type signal peptide-containing protein n=1 Tax=uncultured Gemella sp. TaxID=254352 RepID=UPI0028D6B28E
MIGKNNYYLKNTKEGTKVESYSIKKFKVGAASVVIGASIFFGAGAVAQASESVSNNTTTDESLGTDNKLEVAPKAQAKAVVENTKESVAAAVASKLENSEKETLNKTALTKLIEEIDGKFTNGKYASKTEDSVNKLKVALEEARIVLNNAKTQAELTQAQAKLVTATTKLQTKPEDKKEAPAVDTTNGKPTVGKKATNTEKASDSNSIANSGSRDERNGKALDTNNPFRTDAATTDTDTAANQTYTLPGDSANLKEVADSLINLPTKITNETKIASINEVGALQNMAHGELKDINEFGGWKASNGGVFAIARKTDKGVFPIETVNTVLVDYGPYQTWLNESTFDRSQDYALFLAEVRTKATKDEAVDDGSVYRPENHYANKGIGLAKFKGIEKTFKAYSKSTGSDVIVSFKTGFTGDIDGRKAKYRVEVFAKDESGTTSKIYDQTFKSDENKEDATKKVVAPRIGGNQYFNTNREPLPTREALNEKLAQDSNKRRLSTSTGTFTSKGIVLAPNVTEYTVRISPGDNANLGMGYQVPWKQYALPISGLGFTIDQDTSRVAKTLLQRVYDKLKETEERDTKGKTEATINAYKTQLENVKNLLAGDLKKTQDYKNIVTAVLTDQQALRTDKSKLVTSNNKLLNLINETPDPRIGKTPNSITPYDSAKEEAIKAQEAAQTILNQENPDPDLVASAASKLNEKLAELKAARAELVVAATTEQKTKLQNDSDALKEADKTNKTPNSIIQYNAKYRELEAALTAAKAQAKAVLDKAENAGKVEATDAQIEVDKIKAELEKAAALLKEKGNTTELEKAKNDLKTLTQETNVTAGKTQATADKYDAAKTAAEAAVTAAEAVINDENVTAKAVAEALANVNAKKAALEAAKTALVDKVTEAQKTTLGNAGTDLAVLGDTELAGKTKATADAYKAETGSLTADIEEAKKEAAAILADPENKTQAEAALVQAKIEALKAKLEAAKAKLVAKADTAELSAAKAELDTKAKEVVPTEGKTKATVDAYNEAKAAAEAAVTAAEAVINDENVTA